MRASFSLVFSSLSALSSWPLCAPKEERAVMFGVRAAFAAQPRALMQAWAATAPVMRFVASYFFLYLIGTNRLFPFLPYETARRSVPPVPVAWPR